jgi:hypothetical protein
MTHFAFRTLERATADALMVERWSPRAHADAHAGAVANGTMPRHRAARVTVGEHAVGGPFATSRAVHPPLRLHASLGRPPKILCPLLRLDGLNAVLKTG